ncbi:MAG: hypothetical protein ACREQ9_12480 [Candidatus Binatia bacterium]
MTNGRTAGAPVRSAGIASPLSLGPADVFALLLGLVLLAIAALWPPHPDQT